ncbi:MAG TPA: hypothetical protein VJ836_04440 [Candidatus Saccharimonadales bacterium]|nr:hypothetical protein [Candidatus Saccharimonadales bacterium]
MGEFSDSLRPAAPSAGLSASGEPRVLNQNAWTYAGWGVDNILYDLDRVLHKVGVDPNTIPPGPRRSIPQIVAMIDSALRAYGSVPAIYNYEPAAVIRETKGTQTVPGEAEGSDSVADTKGNEAGRANDPASIPSGWRPPTEPIDESATHAMGGHS